MSDQPRPPGAAAQPHRAARYALLRGIDSRVQQADTPMVDLVLHCRRPSASLELAVHGGFQDGVGVFHADDTDRFGCGTSGRTSRRARPIGNRLSLGWRQHMRDKQDHRVQERRRASLLDDRN